MEETKERVMVSSTATTEVASGSKELGDQIARLMAALTMAEQGSHPASAPNSPRHRGCGRGQMDRNTHVHPRSHNGQTGLGQTTSVCSSLITNREGVESPCKETSKCRMVYRVVHKVPETPTPCNVLDVRVGVTCPGSMLLQPKH